MNTRLVFGVAAIIVFLAFLGYLRVRQISRDIERGNW